MAQHPLKKNMKSWVSHDVLQNAVGTGLSLHCGMTAIMYTSGAWNNTLIE